MKEAIHTDRAPAAIGPYSQAVRAGGFLFTSGQIPVDPAAGDIPAGIKAQAQQSLNNIAATLAQAGPGPVRRGEDHCVSQGHERFRRHERGVRPVL